MSKGTLFFVDCEAPWGVGAPSVGDMTEFGAVVWAPEPPFDTFYGTDCHRETFEKFETWLHKYPAPRIMWSDNPAYDFQWINFYFWKYRRYNPFGHSARRIGDFYAGLVGDVRAASKWKCLRVTPHTHHPVEDAIGNVEAFTRMLAGERGNA